MSHREDISPEGEWLVGVAEQHPILKSRRTQANLYPELIL